MACPATAPSRSGPTRLANRCWAAQRSTAHASLPHACRHQSELPPARAGKGGSDHRHPVGDKITNSRRAQPCVLDGPHASLVAHTRRRSLTQVGWRLTVMVTSPRICRRCWGWQPVECAIVCTDRSKPRSPASGRAHKASDANCDGDTPSHCARRSSLRRCRR